MSYRLNVGMALLFACSAVFAQQQDPAIEVLDEVVVSDSRFELKREQSGKTVIRIGTEELARNQGRTAAELINSKSGIEIAGSRGRQGEVLGVYARGGRGRQVVVLIDGVRVSDPSSFSREYDLRLLSLDGLESIEIIKGASSTLYGTNAATAVISITTKKASDEKFRVHLGSSVGTNQSADDHDYSLAAFNNYARFDGSIGRLEYQAGFSQAYSDNLSSLDTTADEEDPFSRYSANFRLGYRPSDLFNMSIYGNKTHFKSAYDESFGGLDAPYEFNTIQKSAGFTTSAGYRKGEVLLNAAFTEFYSENISAFPGTFEGRSQVVDLYNKYTFGTTIFTLLGLNYTRERVIQGEAKEFTLLDPYLNVVYISEFGFNLNTGVRLNTHTEYGQQWVYNLNPSYTLASGDGYLKFMGTLATAYITPSLSQLFGEFGANPSLEPENDQTIETGLEWKVNTQFRANILYFNRNEENFVFFDSTDFLYKNASGTIKARGVELEARWQLAEQLHLEANYTYTERKGDNAIRIPRHKVFAEMGVYLSKRTYSSLQYSYTGTRPDTDFSTFSDVRLNPFSLLNLFLSQDVLPGKMKVFASAENILNVRYTEIIGFSTRGRNVQLGFNLVL